MTLTETQMDQFRARVILDALDDATAHYWRRRAQAFRDAAPRPGDFHGRATAEDLSAAWRRCTRLADLCEHRATLARPDRVVAA